MAATSPPCPGPARQWPPWNGGYGLRGGRRGGGRSSGRWAAAGGGGRQRRQSVASVHLVWRRRCLCHRCPRRRPSRTNGPCWRPVAAWVAANARRLAPSCWPSSDHLPRPSSHPLPSHLSPPAPPSSSSAGRHRCGVVLDRHGTCAGLDGCRGWWGLGMREECGCGADGVLVRPGVGGRAGAQPAAGPRVVERA